MAIVYLHIGSPKTATSTLQHVLASNYERLLKDGVLYPRDMRNGDAHHLLACDLIEKYQGKPMPDIWYGSQPRAQAWKSLLAEIELHKNNIHSVVISSEIFFPQINNIDSILEDVCDYLHGHEVRVITYLRRQDQLYSSFYNQDVKGIRQWFHSAYQFYETHQIFLQDYCTVLNSWGNVFGKGQIIIRPFEAEQWVGGDIVLDFCDLVGVKPPGSNYRQNEDSLGETQLYLKQCLNKVGFDKSQNDEVLKIIFKLCPEQSATDCLYVHAGLYRKYRDNWLHANRSLEAEYLGGRSLFSQCIPEAKDLRPYKIDKSKVAVYAQNMLRFFEKGKYPQYRILFAKATLMMLAEQDLWHALQPEERTVLLGWV